MSEGNDPDLRFVGESDAIGQDGFEIPCADDFLNVWQRKPHPWRGGRWALIVVCLRRPHCELQKGIPSDGDRPSRPVLNELIDVLHLNQPDM